MKRLLALPIALLLALAITGTTFAGTSYEDIKLRGQVLTNQINKWRSPDLNHMYLLSKVANQRAQARLDEFHRTGTYEFEHNMAPVQNALENADICYKVVGEAIGYTAWSFDDMNPSQIANRLADLWYASDNHRPMLQATRYNRGGGSWVTDGWIVFFAYYVLDTC